MDSSKQSTTPKLQRKTTTVDSSGWLVVSTFFFNTNSSTAAIPDYVTGTHTGVCLPIASNTNKANVTSWVDVTCDDSSYQIHVYASENCEGQALYEEIISFTDAVIASQTAYSTVQYACVADSSTLPLPENVDYSVSQSYLDYVADSCNNAATFEAIINGKCLQTNVSSSVFASFPWYARYNASDGCTGSFVNYTATEGCYAETSATATVTHSSLALTSFHHPIGGTKRKTIDHMFDHFLLKRVAGEHALTPKNDIETQGFIYDDDYSSDSYTLATQASSYTKVIIISDNAAKISSDVDWGKRSIADITVGGMMAVAFLVVFLCAIGVLGNDKKNASRSGPAANALTTTKKNQPNLPVVIEMQHLPRTTTNPMVGDKV
jgi:hypothetical protein